MKMCNVRNFYFDMGAYMTPNISIESKDGQLQFGYDQFGSSAKRCEERVCKKIITPSDEAWVEFLETFSDIDVQDWSNNVYRDDDVLDGTSWRVDIDITLGKNEEVIYQADASGYAVFPNGFDAFIHSIEKLIHDSITSWVYNSQVMKDFIEDNIKGEENRKNLFMKVSPIILEIIEAPFES